MEALKTKNYDQFKFLKMNRPVRGNVVKHLAEAIKKSNKLEKYPILVNEKLEVFDGQHRLMAAKNLGLDIYYQIDPVVSVDDIRDINANQTRWRSTDYVNYYVELGNTYYIQLAQLCEEYGMASGLMTWVLEGVESRMTGSFARFASGELSFTPEDKEIAINFLNSLRKLSPYLSHMNWKNRNFVRAFWSLLHDYGFTETEIFTQVRAFSASGERKFEVRHSVREYLRFFEDVMSFNKSKQVRLV